MENLNGTIEVTTAELTAVLMAMPNGIGSFAKVLQYTEPKTTKKCRDTKEPFSSTIKKLTSLSVLLNTQYESGVLNQLKKENKEESEYKKGTNTMPIDFELSNNEFAGFYNGKAVIQYRPFDNSKPSTKFILDGKVTDKENIPNVLPKKSKATNQGTEKEIFWRKLYVANIRKIKVNGVTYKNIECK